jgi:hypothetical protein
MTGFIAGSLLALFDHTRLWIVSVLEVKGQGASVIDGTSPGVTSTPDPLDAIPFVKDGKKSARKRKGKSKAKVHQEDASQ